MSAEMTSVGWERVPLHTVAEINPSQPERNVRDEEEVSFIPMAAVEELTGRLDSTEVRPWGEIRTGYKRFQEGDVLFAKITPSMENGKVALAQGLVRGVGAGSTEFHVVRPFGTLHRQYLLHYLLQHEVRGRAQGTMKGTAGQLRVPEAFLSNLEIPLPPLATQKAVVELVEKRLSQMENAAIGLERVRTKLDRYRTSVLQAAFEGRLVPTEAGLARRESRDYEPADELLNRVLAERRARWEAKELQKLKAEGKEPGDDRWKKKYTEPEGPDTSELPEVAEGWVWATVDQLTINRDRKRVPLKRSDRSKRQGPFPYYGASGVIDYIDDYLFDGRYLLIAEDGANLRSRSTPVAFVAEGKFWVNNHAHVVDPLPGVQLDFLMHAFNAKDIQFFLSGSAQPKLTQAVLRGIPIPLPPAAEQERIQVEIERQESKMDQVVRDVGRCVERSLTLRQSVLRAAFSGRSDSLSNRCGGTVCGDE